MWASLDFFEVIGERSISLSFSLNITCCHFLAAISRENGTDLPSLFRTRIKIKERLAESRQLLPLRNLFHFKRVELTVHMYAPLWSRFIAFPVIATNIVRMYFLLILCMDLRSFCMRYSPFLILVIIGKFFNVAQIRYDFPVDMASRKLAVPIYSNYFSCLMYMYLCVCAHRYALPLKNFSTFYVLANDLFFILFFIFASYFLFSYEIYSQHKISQKFKFRS